MMKHTGFRSTENSMRHSTPMSFFSAPSCAQEGNTVILGNTVISVLLFLLSLVVLILPILLLPIILLAVVIITARKQNTVSYYKRKD